MQQLELFDKPKKIKKPGYPFKKDEMEKVEALCKLGVAQRQIGKVIGRSPSSLQRIFSICGGKEFYSAEKHYQHQQEIKRLKIEKLRKPHEKLPHKKMLLEERVESLEMQIEILLETVKKLTEQK